jgi:hypothetical protein
VDPRPTHVRIRPTPTSDPARPGRGSPRPAGQADTSERSGFREDIPLTPLLSTRHDEHAQFKTPEKPIAIRDDYKAENDEGSNRHQVNGKAVRFRDTSVLEDAHGDEIAPIRDKKLPIRHAITIEVGEMPPLTSPHLAERGVHRIEDGAGHPSSAAP